MKFATVRNEIIKMFENNVSNQKIMDYIDTLFIKKKINKDVYDRAITLYLSMLKDEIDEIIYG